MGINEMNATGKCTYHSSIRDTPELSNSGNGVNVIIIIWESQTRIKRKDFQVSLISDMCIIAFEGNLFLLVPSMTNRLSSHLPLEDPLMSSNVMFDPSCYGFGNLDDTSLVELNIVAFARGFDRNSLQHVFTITSMRGRRHTMEFEGQGIYVVAKL
ncbi:hypothetical protein M9H77_00423 [Catharanthus roseus]|nr:hypothetical protein M9H77_00423 [Catharanthus roseus]